MDVSVWLGRLGLPQYAPAFAENAIDGEVLEHLTGDDLKELGVGLLGHRRKLLTAIESLRSRQEASSSGDGEELRSGIAQGGSAPERRHLTVLFCELAGSSALSASLDPEDFRDVLRNYHSVVAKIVPRP